MLLVSLKDSHTPSVLRVSHAPSAGNALFAGKECPCAGTDAESDDWQPRAPRGFSSPSTRSPARVRDHAVYGAACSAPRGSRLLVGDAERLGRVDRPPTDGGVVTGERLDHEVLWAERLGRRRDSQLVCAREPETLVVPRAPLDQDERLLASVGQPKRLAHERTADPAALVRREHGERAELEHAPRAGLEVDIA